ncbi:MAG: imidazole glycerol phosphate synthase subunit HisH [Desulfurococcales archaeon]|nr:imidazole glycerol phosphate synthase subunit HisH [Desulfurococcales archaeon]
MAPLIIVYKYGVGNVYSVKASLERAGARVRIVESLSEAGKADAVVFPGVGSMPAAMRKLEREKDIVYRLVEKSKPLLGICLGMQLLYEAGTEHGYTRGLGLLRGIVERLRVKPLPHMGWSVVERVRGSALLEGLPERFYAYYAHSYAPKNTEAPHVRALTREGFEEFVAVVEKGSVYGTQFHPEKSGRLGQAIISNFVALSR